MVRIECSVWEKRQLTEYLEYAKKKYCEDCNNDKITVGLLNIELDRINNLLEIINGKVVSDYDRPSKAYIEKYHGYYRND